MGLLSNRKSPFEVLESLELSNKKMDKQGLLSGLTTTEKELIVYALDPCRVFNITSSFLKPSKSLISMSDTKAAEQLVQLLDKLQNRILTGNDAIYETTALLSKFSPLARKWALRIIDKNLRVGVDTTFHKMYPTAYVNFNLQLCDAWTDEYINGWYAQPKFDGIRAICIPSGDSYIFLSRKGKPVFGTENVITDLKSKNVDLYLDGELFSKNFDETIHNTRTETAKKTNLIFYAFDALTKVEWDTKKTASYSTRVDRLSVLDGLKYVQPVSYTVVDYKTNPPASIIDKHIADGYEGAVFKDPKSSYEWKRRSTWLKGKKMHTFDLQILGAEEGTGRLSGTLGALLVDYNGIMSKVGTGFDDEQRSDLWALHTSNKLCGLIVEVNAQEITKDGKLRFPAFVRMRPDK